MGISVILKDQTGEVLVRLGKPYLPLVGWADRSEFPMLGHIDPYGNTVYNRGQMNTLLLELERVRDNLSTTEVDKEKDIEELDSICTEGMKKPHRFLWFVGD